MFCLSSIKFMVAQGKEGIIDFTAGSQLLVAKAKNGHLSVVSGLISTQTNGTFSIFNFVVLTCRFFFLKLKLEKKLVFK